MNYPIPANPEEVVALQQKSVDEELIAAAIAGVIQISRLEGKSLEQLTEEVLADDSLLDMQQRRWLKEVVAQAWQSIA
ncbi:hypothetical protein NIES2119_11510 [[Phormidium ambiguum] IAM M-71]|uniref:Uncharacterized protein n=1 Tax=[Phormidium ambiguum] IAM M-71 TaxID=454136 RepID=A0A1U7ILW3_9CYAN|nr:hypothetical protein [Phormidium ambiguum]OKH38170.1 hypothetical protein NIES2119_11510 [Phormidium ambiguum IAM M-71]